MNTTIAAAEESNYFTDSTIWKFVAPLLIPLGLCENIISILVLARRKFQNMPSRRSLICLSICDSVVLVIGLTRFWTVAVFEFHPNEFSKQSCLILSFIVFVSSHWSAGILATISVERVITVFSPALFRTKVIYIDRYGAVIALMIITAVNMHIPFTTILRPNELFNISQSGSTLHQNICVSISSEAAVVVDIVDMTLLFYIPFTVILTCNAAIIYRMRKSTRRISKPNLSLSSQNSSLPKRRRSWWNSFSKQENHQPESPFTKDNPDGNFAIEEKTCCVDEGDEDKVNTELQPPLIKKRRKSSFAAVKAAILNRSSTRKNTAKRRDTKVTHTLLLVTFMFFFCNLPFSIVNVYRTITQNDTNWIWNRAYIITYVLVFLNNCMNFPIYVISHPLFRKELFRLFSCLSKLRRNSGANREQINASCAN